MKKYSPLIIIALLWVSSTATAASLETALSEEQFKQFGLHKLSPEELAGLSAWVMGTVEEEKQKVVEEIIPVGEDRFGAAEKIQRNVERIRPEPKRLESRILGPFKGWRGHTVFKLENGQVWQQSDPDRFVVNLQDPEVIIRKGMMGTYFLRVKGYGSQVKVKRIE